MPHAAAAELIAVAPGSEFGAQRLTDTYQLGALPQPRESDLIGGEPHAGAAEESLALLDRFPAIVKGREVPALALAADHPEPAFRGVEGDAPAYAQVLHDGVLAEVTVTEEAAAVHELATAALAALSGRHCGNRDRRGLGQVPEEILAHRRVTQLPHNAVGEVVMNVEEGQNRKPHDLPRP